MVPTDLNTALLEMIHLVGQAPSERAAAANLLYPLLHLFDMDQAAICEWDGDDVASRFAMDRTRKLLPADGIVWLSSTLVRRAFDSFEPTVYSPETRFEGALPKSVSDHELKSVVCIPVSRAPDRFVYLASRRDPERRFGPVELNHLKIATRAATLALRQHATFLELRASNEKLRTEITEREGGLVYGSSAMESLVDELARIAPFNVCIRIQGESGTGKEELAKEIHRLSRRPGRFIAVNCANLTETLLESELFGYARGAFTGATQAKKGLITDAEGGTFLLDEIAELPLNLQSKLLRVLQERVVRPLGANQDTAIDVRFIVASHRDLASAVAAKEFREDLFYRIDEHAVEVPALRDRPDDVPLLANHFLHRFVAEFRMPKRAFSSAALDALRAYAWPGNIRELKNIVRTGVILSRGDTIEPAELRLVSDDAKRAGSRAREMPEASPDPGATEADVHLRELTRQYEYSVIEKMLAEAGQTQATVARRLGISIRTLQRILEKDRFGGGASIHAV